MSATYSELVREFCNRLPAGDMQSAGRFLHENVYYHNQPWEPLTGRDSVCNFLQPYVDGTYSAMTSMTILDQVSEGSRVMNAREEIWERGDVRIMLPVAGLFEIEDEVITRWVDYWDLATFQPILDAIAG